MSNAPGPAPVGTSRYFPIRGEGRIMDASRRWLAGERWEVPAARTSSTVMLVRDATAGVEVFMLRRVSGMAFAPNTMVFPGGGCDDRDGDPHLPWAGPTPAEWGERLGCDEAHAQMFVAAAVREVFEECGVMLASETADGELVDVSDPAWRTLRDGLIRRELSLAGVLEERRLRLRSDLMAVKAHWVTPEFEPRRFDTWFFAALMPAHQAADGETSEADHSAWFEPADLIERAARAEAIVMPPTLMCLEEVRDAASAREFVRHTERVPVLMPELVDTPEGPVVRIVMEES